MSHIPIVHHWDDIQRFVDQRPSLLPCHLIVPTDTVRLYGIPFVAGLVNKTRDAYDSQAPILWTDCDVYPGIALSAMRHGLTHLLFSGDRMLYERLNQMMGDGGMICTRNSINNPFKEKRQS